MLLSPVGYASGYATAPCSTLYPSESQGLHSCSGVTQSPLVWIRTFFFIGNINLTFFFSNWRIGHKRVLRNNFQKLKKFHKTQTALSIQNFLKQDIFLKSVEMKWNPKNRIFNIKHSIYNMKHWRICADNLTQDLWELYTFSKTPKSNNICFILIWIIFYTVAHFCRKF